jgi:hypothetical protein
MWPTQLGALAARRLRGARVAVAFAPAMVAPTGDGQTPVRRSSSAGGRSERRRPVLETMAPGRSWVGTWCLPKQEGGGYVSSAATCAAVSYFGWGSGTATSDLECRAMSSWHRERWGGEEVEDGDVGDSRSAWC